MKKVYLKPDIDRIEMETDDSVLISSVAIPTKKSSYIPDDDFMIDEEVEEGDSWEYPDIILQ